MIILGIESSCDETAAAVINIALNHKNARSRGRQCSVLSNVVASQVKVHSKTGGIVPEVAAREHYKHMIPVIAKALEPLMNYELAIRNHEKKLPKAKKLQATSYKLTNPGIDAIAVTYGPGLITSLSIGLEAARMLAWAWKVPVIPINHLEGHIAAALLKEENQESRIKNYEHRPRNQRTEKRKSETDPILYSLYPILYPALALVVSGKHTELVFMKRPKHYSIIGATRDDAVGEAFDKVARILGYGYPGGPIVSRMADSGNSAVYPFKPPMMGSKDYDFSFSGIKTAVLYTVRDLNAQRSTLNTADINNICASFQKAVVDVLIAKTIRAANEYHCKTIIVGGGVAANKQLCHRLGAAVAEQLPTVVYYVSAPRHSTDNALMIALAGYFRAVKGEWVDWRKLEVNANLSFANL